MRLFTAIALPEPLKDRLAQLRTDIRGAAWTRREGYHLTLRFLGDGISEHRAAELQAALEGIRHPPFDVMLQGVGRFPPNPRKPPRVIWVGIKPNAALQTLYQAVERAAIACGFPPDDHTFSGHITLARLKHDKPDPSVGAFLNRSAAFKAEPFRVMSFHLYSSELSPQGARYTVLATFALSE